MVEGCLRVHAARRDGDGSRACEYPARRDEAEERADDNGGLSFFFFFRLFVLLAVVPKSLVWLRA